MTFQEYIQDAFSWIKTAIQTVWLFFRVIIVRVIVSLKSFMRIIGDAIKDMKNDIISGLKRLFIIKSKKTDFKGIIEKANKDGKVEIIPTTFEEMFEEVEETEYDYNIVVTDGDFNSQKIETISADELDKKIGLKFSEEVSELKF